MLGGKTLRNYTVGKDNSTTTVAAKKGDNSNKMSAPVDVCYVVR